MTTLQLLTSTQHIEQQDDRDCADGHEGKPVTPPARADVPATLSTAEPSGDQLDPTPLSWIVRAQEGKIELSLDDDRRWYLYIDGQANDVDARMLRDLVHVLQRPEVRAALLLLE